MHYYQFNIGDYRRRTSHLTPLEHGIYRLLLDTYYLNEQPLCSDDAKLMRTHSIRTEDEQQALKNVIEDFFILEDDGYHHAHCDEEIAKYREKSEKAAASARARWEKKANGMRTHSEGNANHKPITNNHKPITKEKKKKTFVLPEWIDPEVWKAFEIHRQRVKAPMTDHAKNLMIKKLEKLNGNANDVLNQSIENGWKGVFEIKLENNNGTNQQDNRSRAQKHQDKLREIAQRDIEQNGFTTELD